MFLTIFYIGATFFQSYRIRRVYTKIAEKLAEKNSLVFYILPDEINDIMLATSELCTNRSQARIVDLLWLRGNQRGCSLLPLQNVHLGPWVSFPSPPNLIPIESAECSSEIPFDDTNLVHLLIETDIVPNQERNEDTIVMIEKFGKPIAWKVDSHFAVLLETDLDHFTKLIMATFMQDNFIVNDYLPLIRIQSIKFEGTPQPFDQMKNHLRKQLLSRTERKLTLPDWQKHLEGLRSLSVLANQAAEFEYNKNRTEGKTGIVKPDLIPSTKNIEEQIVDCKTSPLKKHSPNKTSTPKMEAKVSPMKRVIDIEKEIVTKTSREPPAETAVSKKVVVIETKETPIEIKEKVNLVLADAEPDKKSISPQPKIVVGKVAPQQLQQKQEQPITPPKQIPPLETISKNPPESISAKKDNAKRPSLRRNKGSLGESKPPNVLVYSDSISIRDSTVATLKHILENNTYTVYPLTSQQVHQKVWTENTCLLVVCGSVKPSVGEILLDYFLRGGYMLSLCSDVLHYILPTFRTAEVREEELVQFSYDKWQKVKMMHHIFCYQPSPVKKHFSTDSDESAPTISKKPALVCPRSVEMKDLQGDLHNLEVKILGTEETWNTPSLLLASNIQSGGRAVFSQVHLEADPSQFEADEAKFLILKQNDKIRLEIFGDLLSKYLKVIIKKPDAENTSKVIFTNAYFLGRHDLKFEILEKLKERTNAEKIIQTSKLTMKFCDKGEIPPSANTDMLPILIHSCPEDFSTIDYFDTLVTKNVGRLVIYAPVVSSTMHVVSDLTLGHGMAVITRQQTEGVGRNNNQWLSPEGCVMFSLQLHVPLKSPLGSRIPLIQHMIGVAIANGIVGHEIYKILDIGVKWPNDIYANGSTKIGGLIVTSTINATEAIINTGCALNLSNSTPTTCVNDLIKSYNRNNNKTLPVLGYEKTLALIFNEIERLFDRIQLGDFEHMYDLYYKYWLHSQQEIKIVDKNNQERSATVIGIDDFGYLKVKTSNGRTESVQPDGNSFDMLKGLILPK